MTCSINLNSINLLCHSVQHPVHTWPNISYRICEQAYIAQYFHNMWVSAGENQGAYSQIQQQSSGSNEIVEFGAGEANQSACMCRLANTVSEIDYRIAGNFHKCKFS